MFLVGFRMMVDLPSLVSVQSANTKGYLAYSLTVNVTSVHAAPRLGSPVIGLVRKPGVVMALDLQDTGDWRHVSGAAWDGWLLATDVSVRYKILGAPGAELFPFSGQPRTAVGLPL